MSAPLFLNSSPSLSWWADPFLIPPCLSLYPPFTFPPTPTSSSLSFHLFLSSSSSFLCHFTVLPTVPQVRSSGTRRTLTGCSSPARCPCPVGSPACSASAWCPCTALSSWPSTPSSPWLTSAPTSFWSTTSFSGQWHTCREKKNSLCVGVYCKSVHVGGYFWTHRVTVPRKRNYAPVLMVLAKKAEKALRSLYDKWTIKVEVLLLFTEMQKITELKTWLM